MILKTKNPINFDQWIEQASKFTQGLDSLITRNIPEKTDLSGSAEIQVNVLQPLYKGFKGEVTYRQHFKRIISIQEYNDEGVAIGDPVDTEIDQSLDIIKYIKIIEKQEANAIFQQVDQMVDPSIVGFDRDEAKIMTAILLDVVAHGTFGGLKAEDYDQIF